MAPSQQIELVEPPANLMSGITFAPTSPTKFAVSCWDSNLYLYDLAAGADGGGGAGCLQRKYAHPSALLGVCFGAHDSDLFTACADRYVRRINLATGNMTTVSQHPNMPAVKVEYSREHSLLLSTSWDKTLHVSVIPNDDAAPLQPPLVIELPAKPFALSLSRTKAVVAMANRLLNIYNLADLALVAAAKVGSTVAVEPWQQRESSLKFMTRAVTCMPTDLGYATSSIEGRIAVEWFDSSEEVQAKKYAFKAHRKTLKTAGAPADDPVTASADAEDLDVAYPVNALVFHPIYRTFASGGGDGTVAVWDASAKRRVKQYPAFPDSVHCLAFSSDGKYLAVGLAPGFGDEILQNYEAGGKARIMIRVVGDEMKGKGAK